MTSGSPWPSISMHIRSTKRVAICWFPSRPAVDAEHDPVDLVEVPLHLDAGPLAVALADRRDDALMLVGMPAAEIARQHALLEAAPGRVVAGRRDDVVDAGEDDVLGGPPERPVQLAVERLELLQAAGLSAARDHPLHMLDLLQARAQGGDGDGTRFEGEPQFHDVRRVGQARDRDGGLAGAAGPRRPSRRAQLRDEGAAADLAHDLALRLKRMHGLADGVAAGAKLRHQLELGG